MTQLPVRAGTIQSWSHTPAGLSGNTTTCRFRVQYFNPHILRITLSRNDAFTDNPYAVVASPQPFPITPAEDEHDIVVQTDVFKTIIKKNELRFIFTTNGGVIINEDEPAFATSWIGDQVTTYKKLQKNERFIGLGEKTGGLNKKGKGFTNWNTDTFGYTTSADPIYSTIPFYIGLHGDLVYGIFFDNTHKSFFNFGASNDRFSSFGADMGDMDYYFIYGYDVADIIRNYTYLTGRMPLPPRWSIGYQQCRYSYYPDKEVLTVAQTFRDKNIPADTIVLDIHYMDAFKIFTWDDTRFPDPKGLVTRLKEMGFHVVVICDPGIKTEAGYDAYEDGLKRDVFLKYPDGTNYSGEVWPGWCHFPDFTNAKTREWWGDHFHAYTDIGIQGFWNDMNEFSTWGNMLPEHVLFSFEGNPATMRRGRNLYGLLMAKSTFEGAKKHLKGLRPFNLTRSCYSGIQRYAAVWTGDNVSYDEHMLLGVRMVTNLGLSGVSFAGYDVGGFVGDAGIRLYARWFSISVFSPFFRSHTMINSRDAEPWTFGEEVEQICRNYMRMRYRLLPYIYSLFYESSETGMPVQRSLAISYPHSDKVYQYDNQYLFGPYLLVAPVESDKSFVKVYLPEGAWYLLYDGTRYEGEQEVIVEAPLDKLPVFVKAGAIIPMQEPVSHTGISTSLLELHVYKTDTLETLVFYTDDGETYAHENGGYFKQKIDNDANSLTLNEATGSYKPAYDTLRIVLHGFKPLKAISVNGSGEPVEQSTCRLLEGLEKFDPFYDPPPPVEEPVQIIELPFSGAQTILSW